MPTIRILLLWHDAVFIDYIGLIAESKLFCRFFTASHLLMQSRAMKILGHLQSVESSVEERRASHVSSGVTVSGDFEVSEQNRPPQLTCLAEMRR